MHIRQFLRDEDSRAFDMALFVALMSGVVILLLMLLLAWCVQILEQV